MEGRDAKKFVWLKRGVCEYDGRADDFRREALVRPPIGYAASRGDVDAAT